MYPYTPAPRFSIGNRSLLEYTHRENRESSQYLSVPYYRYWKSLTGYKGPKDLGPKQCRPVTHIKLSTLSFQPVSQKDERYSFWNGEGVDFNWFPESTSMDAMSPGLFASKLMVLPEEDFPPPDVDSVVDRAVDQMYRPPDLLSFVVEGVREFPGLMYDAWRQLRFLNLPRQIRNDNIQYAINQVRTPRQAADLLSDRVLETNLGFYPTVSDLSGIWSTLQRGLRQYLAAEEALSDPDGFRVVFGKRLPVTRGFGDQLGVGDYRCMGTNIRTYGCYVRANFPQGDYMASFTRSAQAAIGLNWDLATVWNLVPLSFLVDYFLPVGDALRRARIFTDLTIDQGSAWVSDRYEGEFFGSCAANYSGEPGVTTFAGCHNGIFTVYNRRGYTWDVPDSIAVSNEDPFSFNGLSATQWANTLALTHALGLRRIARAQGL